MTKHTRRKSHNTQLDFDMSLLKQAYNQRISVSEAKKADLIKLCISGVIPRLYHSFYSDLPTSNTVKDILPQPDATEISAEEDDCEQ
jgi:hypothetical protein